MNELKTCPFCGRKAELIGVPKTEALKYVVLCKDCCNTFPHNTEEEAVEAWNRRAE